MNACQQALEEGFQVLPVETWLQVIPQLMARIHSTVKPVRRLVLKLLCEIGHAHPQALVYPVTVATKVCQSCVAEWRFFCCLFLS